jgi:hypothetical protein
MGKILQVIWTSGTICAKVWGEGDKFLSKITFTTTRMTYGPPWAKLTVYPPLVRIRIS